MEEMTNYGSFLWGSKIHDRPEDLSMENRCRNRTPPT